MEKKMIESEKNELIEVEEEVNESKIMVLEDFTPVITNVVLEPQVLKNYTVFIARVSVKNLGDIKVRVDENLVNYVKLCQKLGKQPFKSKLVVKEYNSEKQKNYVCLKFVSLKDNVYRYFIDRADVESLELVFDIYNETLKK